MLTASVHHFQLAGALIRRYSNCWTAHPICPYCRRSDFPFCVGRMCTVVNMTSSCWLVHRTSATVFLEFANLLILTVIPFLFMKSLLRSTDFVIALCAYPRSKRLMYCLVCRILRRTSRSDFLVTVGQNVCRTSRWGCCSSLEHYANKIVIRGNTGSKIYILTIIRSKNRRHSLSQELVTTISCDIEYNYQYIHTYRIPLSLIILCRLCESTYRLIVALLQEAGPVQNLFWNAYTLALYQNRISAS